ncbi:MAG TPA: hypothetical protein VM390_10755 [Acidimicrobiales bacterium]|jgi:hypothetical protein|nr:hypothetical protein [Acidimicrobiales bacterium]
MTTVVLDGRDIVELVAILECLAGSLRAADHAGALLPLLGADGVEDPQNRLVESAR